MKLLLFPSEGEKNTRVLLRVAEMMQRAGVACYCADGYKGILPLNESITVLPQSEAESLCDVFVSIGGDGATLRNAQRSIAADRPLFSINTGRVGYLSAFDAANIDDITPESIRALRESRRMVLDFSFTNDRERHYSAVNDIVIQRNYLNSTVELNLLCGCQAFRKLRGDGIIISSPTGSTAYSLSAGGPIVDPDMSAFIVTPICAHNLTSRSIVLGADNTIMVQATERKDNTSTVSIDGTAVGQLNCDNEGIITVSDKNLRLLLSEKRSFFGILNREFSEKD